MVNSTACGLDTSVVLRLLIDEPEALAVVAKQFVVDSARAGIRLIVSDLVVAEAYFALHHHYDVPKPDALIALLSLLEGKVIWPEEGGVSVLALKEACSSSAKLGFVDRLIHERYLHSGATMATFERSAARLEHVMVLRG